jgi:rhodanese-related sulfurtransferase/biotin operon repressor
VAKFKKSIFEQFAHIAKAMGSGNRLEMLDFLAQCEYSVEDLANLMGLSVANTSHHLQQLRHAGLVTTRKEAQRVFYGLSGDEIIDLVNCLRNVAERHLAEVNNLVDTFLISKDSLEPIPREELLQRARRGLVTVLDVRPPDEYAAGHVPGAVNIPLIELEQHLQELDPEQEMVAYCRGPHCVLAFDAVARLREKGLNARRLQDGFPEWKQAGLPVEFV